MDKKFILDLTVNTTDPKNNKEFLWLSYSINNLSSVKYEKSYWMTLEKRCLSLFSENGYDLQTGAWFCLISSHLYSWEGLAISSWKFADSFVKQKKCWPQSAATQMRVNILVWYIKNVIPVIQTLPNDEKNHSSLTLLEDALTLLTKLEYNLLSGKFFIISDMLAELRRQNGDDTEISDSEQHASAPSDTENIKPVSRVLSSDVKSNDIPVQKNNVSIKDCEKTYRYYNVIYFISGVLLTVFLSYSCRPETALKLKRAMPDGFLTEMLMNYSGCSEITPDSTDSWTQLSKKIDDFIETLKTIEDNGDYITISRLKTIAYDIKSTFLENDTPVNVRISKLYNNMSMGKEDINRELEIIQRNINKFNCEISELKLRADSSLKGKER
ncbi:TPA: VasL domain-containing protein [Escherichia coli]|uniref:VasL domain-containing protein n=1 Tax=Escherichia coli TaxID=562 RepID=UPI0019D0A711|nr:VasL domain-containing protein [Escherichia coli]EKR7173563.1 type VI secretion system ImpA family N-terminal domain-containing protein [Escherichia coli]MBN6692101.1 type VI secretion system ImpA family N-terminal domain-containing protein [Escherichia coli]MDP4344147.1 VasL domain-containing protein [Escherichia coli]MDP4370285.1 VasL domain-containing protein [Escherichia coli]HCU5419661.1 type VI secretion system ImpA family N-terminal domain-containing protein [Escherichia coli]